MQLMLEYFTLFVEIEEAVEQQINQNLVEVKQFLGKQAPKKELKNFSFMCK